MRSTRFIPMFMLAVLITIGLAACDFSEQNYDLKPGNSLAIAGEEQVTVPDTAEYFVRAFTIRKDYTWTIEGEGAEILQVRRDGEYVDVAFTVPGTHTLTVQAVGEGDPDYTGTLEVTAAEAEEDTTVSTGGR